MLKKLTFALVAVFGMVSGVVQASAAEQKILVINQQRVILESEAGKSIVPQAKSLLETIQGEVKAEEESIKKEATELQAQYAILSPEQRDTKTRAFQLREGNFRALVAAKQEEYQYSVGQAEFKIRQALGPVLQEIVNEKSGTILIDRSQLMFATADHDITEEAIKRLNAALKSVKVERVQPQRQKAPQDVKK